MTLEFETLKQQIEAMCEAAVVQHKKEADEVALFKEKIQFHARNWEHIENCVHSVHANMDNPDFFRAAIPFNHQEEINAALSPLSLPEKATLIATDGSQALTGRHDPFLYYLINIGTIIYHHGSGLPPETDTSPSLTFPEGDMNNEKFTRLATVDSIYQERDIQEITQLANALIQYQDFASPVIGLMDQRLLYWPVRPTKDLPPVITDWLEQMKRIEACGAMVAGYIDRPGKASVIKMLQAADFLEPHFQIRDLIENDPPINDTLLFSHLLAPGQRSAVFIEISSSNSHFATEEQEICFFYFNPSHHGRQIARVDIPSWVAKRPSAVDQLHALLYHQCQISRIDYPYLIARADETAVVGAGDKENLNTWITLGLQKKGIYVDQTSKQTSKDIYRAGKIRHEM